MFRRRAARPPSRTRKTAGKTIEEIETLFGRGAGWPWETRPGESLRDAKIELVKAQYRGFGDAAGEKAAVARQEFAQEGRARVA